jgi:outer membrane protein
MSKPSSRACRRSLAFTAALALPLIVAARPASAQSPTRPAASHTTPAAAQAAPATAPLRLALDDAVRMALENNLDIVVDRLEPQVADMRVGQAASAFVPSLGTAFTRNSTLQPPTSALVGSAGLQGDTYTGNVGFGQRLPWFGTSYAVGVDGSNASSASIITNYNPALNSRIQATFSQPLLKDFSVDSARQQLIVSKRNRDISDARFQETVVRTLATVKRSYWDLAAAVASVDVQRQSLALSEELVRMDQARVDVGNMPELDLIAAQAEVAQRQEALTIAEVTARQAEDRLRTLILDPDSTSFWTTTIEVTDRPQIGGPLPNIDEAIRVALAGRQDLRRAKDELEISRVSTRYYDNQRLPDLRVIANYQGLGLAGSRLVRSGGFPGMVVGMETTAWSDALAQSLRRDYPAWTVGVSLSYPLGRSYEDAGLAAARLQEAQAKARLQSLEVRVVRQIRGSAWQLEMNGKRIQTSRAARELAERRVESEQKRFEVGMSTSFLVVQAQRDLAQARNNELSAVLDYARSMTDFEALQQAPLDGASVTVSGSTIVPAGTVPATTIQNSLTVGSRIGM